MKGLQKKNDVFKWCFPTSPLSRQMNWGILNKNFISDIVKYMKNYYIYRQNWKVTTISTIIIFFLYLKFGLCRHMGNAEYIQGKTTGEAIIYITQVVKLLDFNQPIKAVSITLFLLLLLLGQHNDKCKVPGDNVRSLVLPSCFIKFPKMAENKRKCKQKKAKHVFQNETSFVLLVQCLRQRMTFQAHLPGW